MIGPKPKIILLDGGQPQAFADQVVGNAVHQPGGLSITIYKNLPDFTGTLAQEWFEIEEERRAGLAAGVAALVAPALILFLLGVPLVAALAIGAVPAVFAYRFTANRLAGREAREVRSHALTVLAMVRYDGFRLDTAEAACAASLADYGWAHGETAPALIANMRFDYPAVQPWLDANAALLQSWQALRGPPIGPQ